MKLKNVNRGIVLGAVLLIGTTAYVVKDNSDFKKSRPDIEAKLEESVNAIAQSNVGTQQEVKDNWNNIIKDYFTDYSSVNTDMYYMTKSDIIGEVNRDYYKDSIGYITKAAAEVKDVNISKFGANGAKVTFSYSNYYEYSGGCPYFLGFDGLWQMDSDGGYDENGNPIVSDKEAVYGSTIEGDAEVYMVQTDDGWKIGYSCGYGYSFSSKRIDEGAEDDSSEPDVDSESGDAQPQTDSKAEEVSDLG